MATHYPPTTFGRIAINETTSPSYVALGLSLALQIPALGLLLVKQLTAGSILIYAVVLLALYYGIIKRNYLNALAIFISSYGLSLPFRDSATIGHGTYAYAYILIAFFIIFRRTSKSLTKLLPIVFCFFLYWFSWTWGTKPVSFGLTLRLWGAMAGMILTYIAVNEGEDLIFLVWALLLGSALFIPTVFLFQNPEAERFGMLEIGNYMDAGNPASYMAHLAPWIVVGFALVVWVNQLEHKKSMIIGLFTLIVVLVFSTSRSNLVFVGLGMLAIILRALPKRPVFILCFLMAIVVGSAIVIVRNPAVSHYLFGKLPLQSGQEKQTVRKVGPDQKLQEWDRYSSGRISFMRYGIEKFYSSPFAGVGFGNSDSGNQVIHSFWVKLLAESGVLVTLPLLFIVAYQFFRYLWNSNSCLPGLSIGLFLSMVVYGFFGHGLDLTMWPTYGLAFAIAGLSVKRETSSPQDI